MDLPETLDSSTRRRSSAIRWEGTVHGGDGGYSRRLGKASLLSLGLFKA
jgi:hypothetical protein